MIRERRIIGSDQVETVKIAVDGAITVEEIEKLKGQYGEVYEHYIVLYHPPIPQAEAERLKAAVGEIAKIDLSMALKTDLVEAVAKLRDASKPVDSV